jgi:hypothetical protein
MLTGVSQPRFFNASISFCLAANAVFCTAISAGNGSVSFSTSVISLMFLLQAERGDGFSLVQIVPDSNLIAYPALESTPPHTSNFTGHK